MSTRDSPSVFRCFECKKNLKNCIKELIKRFANIHKFYNGDINKSILLLRKAVYPYEYKDCWQTFDETLLPDKEAFYSSLNIEFLQILIIDMQKECLNTLIIKIQVIIMICMFRQTHYYLPMYLKNLK